MLKNFKENTCIIIISHYMDEIQAICSRIGIISKGQLKYIGNTYKFIMDYQRYLN